MLTDGNPVLEAADLHNFAATGASSLDPNQSNDDSSSVSDFFTKGVPLAVGSGLTSMANTAVSLGNAFGGDFDKIDYDKQVQDYDDDLSKYYQDNKAGVDLGGFVLTSFIPGVAGIKALKMIQGGVMGESAAAVTGLFKSKESFYLEKALSSVQTETNNVFRMLDGNKLAAIAAGFGEQTLQAAAFETATMLSMNQNPVINPEDQGYFKTLLYNTPEMIKSALIGGAIGGAIGGLGVAGKIKSAIRLRDKEDFPSLNLPQIGASDIDDGTKAAIDFYWLKNREISYQAQQAAGEINERQVSNFQKTQQQKATELLTRIREDLTDNDADLSKAVFNHLLTADTVGSDGAAETGLRLLGAATDIERVGTEDSIAQGIKIYSGESQLSERHAKNILARGKINPQVQTTVPSGADLEEMKLAGYEMYKDDAGNLRVIPGIKYQAQLNTALDTAKHDYIVKLGGDQAGRISETAYPVLGDTGKVTMDKGVLRVNGVEQDIPDYDPLKNAPLDSNAAFLKERLSPKIHPDLGTVEVDSTDLPRIDKILREGYEDSSVIGPEGEDMGPVTPDLVRQLKLSARQEMVNAGHDFGRISRELNIPMDFAETGQGDFLLNEDHTVPQYAKISYNTNNLPDKNYLRGVNDLMTRIAIAKQHNEKVAAMILGDAWNDLPKTNGTMLGINTIPELGGFIKSADEFYGSFGQLMQSVGKVADREIRDRIGEVLGRVSALHQEILGDSELTRNLNILVAKIRSADEAMVWSDKDPSVMIPRSIQKAMGEKDADADKIFQDAVSNGQAITVKDPTLLAYLQKTQEINQSRVEQINSYFSAKGSSTQWDGDTVYVPPINTRKYPYVAFVKESSASEFRPTSVITAADAESLEAKIRTVKQNYGDTLGIYTKDDIADFYKMQGEYDSGLLLGDSTVDNAVKKTGVLSDFQPRTDSEILEDFSNWHVQQEQALVRNAVELQYAQEFAELRAMGETFMEYQKSKFSRTFTTQETAELRKDNPYDRYISTALATSNYAKYDSVWGKLNAGVEGLGQSMFKAWDGIFSKERSADFDWVDANKEAESYGFRPPFSGVLREILNPVVTNRKIVEPLVAKVNAVLSTTVLRFDFLNSIVNIFGTPGLISAELSNIRRNLSDPDKVGKLTSLLQVGIPGGENQLPSTMKLLSQAVGNFVNDDGSLLKYYTEIGAVRPELKLYKDVLDSSVLTPDALKNDQSITAWAGDLVKKATDLGASLTGNNLSERMVRFVAADVMRQISETAGLDTAEQSAYINTFVNRVHGNYTASQRPALFQGAVGQAISLFQTYQFNVIQNMMRYVEQNDKLSIAALLGMQNTLFGLQGNPAFYLLNSYIGQENREHKDLVTGAYATVGKDVGDWLMYGLGSNALHTNLYNRGDLTPRYVTVVPTTLTDIPAIAIPAKILTNFVDTIGAIAKGGSLKQSILEGLSTNGANRPLAGLAQLAQGYRTTNSGNVLAAYNDLDTVTATAKLMGGEEMNRAIAIDAYYRQLAYKKKDAQTISEVGQALKNKIRSNEPMNSDDVTGFMSQYSRAGGRVDSFNRFMIQSYKDANRSQIDKMQQGLRTPFAKNLSTIMGAQDDDFMRIAPDGNGGNVVDQSSQ